MFQLLCFALICIIVVENTSGDNEIVPYYGVPLGQLFNAARDVRGDVYVSDKKTITVAHFGHKGQPGCTAFVVGPSKFKLHGKKGQHIGQLLSYRKHPQDDKERRNRRSSDREAGLVPRIAALDPNLHPFDWPFDFGRSKADDPIKDSDDKSPVKGQFKIELDKNENAKTPITSPIETTVAGVAASEISTEKPVTRLRTAELEQKPITEKSKPEIALSLDNKPSAGKNEAAPSADGFVEELTLDDLKGTGAAKFTLPSGLKVVTDGEDSAAAPSSTTKRPRRHQSVVLHAPAPIILDERKNGGENDSLATNSTPYVNIQTKNGRKVVSKNGGGGHRHRNRSSRSPRKPRAAEAEISLTLTTLVENTTTYGSDNATTTPLASPTVSESFSAVLSQSTSGQTLTSPPGETLVTLSSSPSSDSTLFMTLDLESSSSAGTAASSQNPSQTTITQNETSVQTSKISPSTFSGAGVADGSPITELSFESSFSASLKGDDATSSPSQTESVPITETTNAAVFGISESLITVEANETLAEANSGENSSESEETTTVASRPARPSNRTFAQRKTTTTPPESKRPKLRHNVPKPTKIDESLPVESSADEEEQEQKQQRSMKQKKPKIVEEQPRAIVEKKVPRKEIVEQEKLYKIVTDRVPKKSQLRKQQLEKSDNEENLERYVEVAAVANHNIPPPSNLTDHQGPPVLRQPVAATRGFSKILTAMLIMIMIFRHIDSVSQSNLAGRYNNPELRHRGEPPTRPAGGIIWSDYTLSPNARRRIDDIHNSEYRYGGPNENAPVVRRPFDVDAQPLKKRKTPSDAVVVNEDNDRGEGSPDDGAPAGPAPPGSRFDYKAERYESLRRAGRLDNFYEAPPTVFAATAAGDDYKSNLLSALHHAERSSGSNNDDQQSAGEAATGSRPKPVLKKSTLSAEENAEDALTDVPPTTIDYRVERYGALKKAGLLDDRTPRPAKTTSKPVEPPLLKGAWYVDERVPNRRLGSKRHRRAMAEPAAVASKNEMNMEISDDSNKEIQYKIASKFDGKRRQEKMINFDSQDDLVTVTLDGRYNLNDFQYLGLYDTCQKEMLSTVALNDVDYPSVAEVSGFRTLKPKNNVNSDKIYIINCNTLYIVNFTFNFAEKTEAFFYVGSGEFPANVVKKEKAHVLGYPESTPLRNYVNENLYVKLLWTTKTFDINWLAVFDEDNSEFLANTVIPPVIVPPCDY
uniref:DM13 domain-containing protein n=1 Tax=Romanomermis culicivorax TaxID=13658 RepID=A0A915HNP5_ROMCU